jgi:hypothetical protein
VIVGFQRTLEHSQRHRLIVHDEHHRSRRADWGRGHTPSRLEMTALLVVHRGKVHLESILGVAGSTMRMQRMEGMTRSRS